MTIALPSDTYYQMRVQYWKCRGYASEFSLQPRSYGVSSVLEPFLIIKDNYCGDYRIALIFVQDPQIKGTKFG